VAAEEAGKLKITTSTIQKIVTLKKELKKANTRRGTLQKKNDRTRTNKHLSSKEKKSKESDKEELKKLLQEIPKMELALSNLNEFLQKQQPSICTGTAMPNSCMLLRMVRAAVADSNNLSVLSACFFSWSMGTSPYILL